MDCSLYVQTGHCCQELLFDVIRHWGEGQMLPYSEWVLETSLINGYPIRKAVQTFK